MLQSNIKTPGVYINEVNAFPNPVVAVATAVPAFIGYTPQAMYQGKSYTNVPVKITSFAEFRAIFCLPDPPAAASPAKQYSPQYYLVQQKSQPATGAYLLINGNYYALLPDANTIYYLYNSIRLFYENGGADAYIVSVGSYGAPSGAPKSMGAQIVNPNVKLTDLTNGLQLLQKEQEPTMYLCPEATLLSVADNGALMQAMLAQSAQMQTAISIFDIIGGRNPDPVMYTNDITTFRNNTGSNGLSYGTAYYPFVGTTMMQSGELTYANLFGGDVKQLLPMVSPPGQPNASAAAIINNILTPAGAPLTELQNHNALLAASTTYTQIINLALSEANLLPPSGGMAGVMTTVDNQEGVWKAPANIAMVGVTSLPISLSESQQANLNLDAVTGKSINVIRNFNGAGILVWGARTLDGNSLDWRYLSVRRTLIMIEQSCKLAANAYVFQPNVANTWVAVKSMISSFLNNIWKQGGLQGATPAAAFTVECGLGSTMTSDYILQDLMRVTVKVALVRPAEFIIITFQQEMAGAG
jgi:phage tail sheath protein FI